jgi:hypothetical protein
MEKRNLFLAHSLKHQMNTITYVDKAGPNHRKKENAGDISASPTFKSGMEPFLVWGLTVLY